MEQSLPLSWTARELKKTTGKYDQLCENGTKEWGRIGSCSGEEAAGESAAAGGQSSAELHVQR